MESKQTRIVGVVRINSENEIICFCPSPVSESGNCKCKSKYDLPDVVITIEPIHGTRPSEQVVAKVAQEQKELENILRITAKESLEIKKGLQNLEKAIKSNRFRI